MIKGFIQLCYGLMLLTVFLAFFFVFLITSTSGLETVSTLCNLFLPGKMTVEGVKGRLIDSFSINRLEYSYPNRSIQIHDLRVNWSLDKVQQLTIHRAQAKAVAIHEKDNEYLFKTIKAKGIVNENEILIKELQSRYESQLISLQGQSLIQSPYSLSAVLILTALNSQTALNGKLVLSGNIHHMNWQGDLHGWVDGIIKGRLDNSKLNQTIQWQNLQRPEFKSPQGDLRLTGILPHFTLEAKTQINTHTPDNWQIHAKVEGEYPHTYQLDGQVSLASAGLNMDSIRLLFKEKKQHWKAKGYISSSGQSIQILGEGVLNKNFSGAIHFKGANFPFIHTKEYELKLSPQLDVHFGSAITRITGKLALPYAQIKPNSFTNSLTLSDDVIFKKETNAQVPTSSVKMDVEVSLGKEVEVTAKGLHAFLQGNVRVQQEPDGPLTAKGELSVIKGEYKAYGQDLTIEQGQVFYTGGALDNPEINVRASKKINTASTANTGSSQILDLKKSNVSTLNLGSTIRAGVEVTGKIASPKIQLFSKPAVLSQSDILSMMIVGTPASQVNAAGAQLLAAAISSMDLGSRNNGIQLMEQLKQNLNVDLNVQTNINYDTKTNQFNDSPAVVVGKSLSKKLYLSYNVGLSSPNVLTLKYLLNQFFSIQMSSSTSGSGVDILYNKSRDSKHKGSRP